MPAAKLNRTLFKLSGEGAPAWLEGLITNSLKTPLTFAALLTPQGKIIADFFVWQGDALYLDTPRKFGEALVKRLKMYRLRAPIEIVDVSDDYDVFAVWDEPDGSAVTDPRNENIGRLLCPKDKDVSMDVVSLEAWNTHRLLLNLPDSEWDFDSADTFPANANMDRLNGIDFKKGCYVGQEVVSRMYRKTDIRKRMCAFKSGGSIEDDKLYLGDRVVGDVMHVHGNLGMAMVRFDRLTDEGGVIRIGDMPVQFMD